MMGYLAVTRVKDGVKEELRIFNDGTTFWFDPTTGQQLRPATAAEADEGRRAFWNLL